MDSRTSDQPAVPAPAVPAAGQPPPLRDRLAAGGGPPLRATARDGLKIVIVGGFGAGKTTLVGAVSEIRPLSTEEVMTRAGIGIDDPSRVQDKNTTTVAFDFGRITLNDLQVLYLFGAPGQQRFWFLWEQLFAGALGAVVLVDTRRIADSWYAIDRLEAHPLPFIVAVNRFDEAPGPPLERVRGALDLDPGVPLIECDARRRDSAKAALITLVRYLTALHDPSAAREPAT
ncbi:GTP-binding protein [Spirillospora sp. CA-253888]